MAARGHDLLWLGKPWNRLSKFKIDPSKNMATRGRGQFPLYTYTGNFKHLYPLKPMVRIVNNLVETKFQLYI